MSEEDVDSPTGRRVVPARADRSHLIDYGPTISDPHVGTYLEGADWSLVPSVSYVRNLQRPTELDPLTWGERGDGLLPPHHSPANTDPNCSTIS